VSETASTTFTYEFTDAANETFDIVVTVSTPPSSFSDPTVPATDAYGVTGISGDIDIGGPSGAESITGIVGTSLAVQTSGDGAAIFDNALFPTSGAGGEYGGASGNTDGIDVYGLEFEAGGQEYNLYAQNGTFEFFSTSNPSDIETLTLTGTDFSCFCAGTHIRTPDGETNVENLKIGDLVLTAGGKATPVRWIGTRAVAVRFADPLRALPIRIKAGALGGGLPVRDLLLSPDHAMYLDGVLIQAGALVNGSSIVREANMPDLFTYYHIETPDHSLILAEGAAAETFIDNVDRMAFDNWGEHEAMYGNAPALTELAYSRAKSSRQVPLNIRARLDEVAKAFAPPAPEAA
jgi:hypothetical protein